MGWKWKTDPPWARPERVTRKVMIEGEETEAMKMQSWIWRIQR